MFFYGLNKMCTMDLVWHLAHSRHSSKQHMSHLQEEQGKICQGLTNSARDLGDAWVGD